MRDCIYVRKCVPAYTASGQSANRFCCCTYSCFRDSYRKQVYRLDPVVHFYCARLSV